MTGRVIPVLFVQGAGEDVHDAWDHVLVDDLRRRLGAGYEVRYPRMPDEDAPTVLAWSAAIRAELDALGDEVTVVGHSVGGTVVAQTLAGSLPRWSVATVALVSAPFLGDGGWPGSEFELPIDLGARLPPGTRIHIFHGLADEVVPPEHARVYARVIPQARLLLLGGRDHQLNGDMSEVAEAIRGGPPST